MNVHPSSVFRALSLLYNVRFVQDFIEQLLMVDASRRMTAAQAMTHPWLLATADSLATHGINLEELKIFNAKRKLLAAVRVVRRKGMVEKAVIAQVSVTASGDHGQGRFHSV